jgi:hypothetical protein
LDKQPCEISNQFRGEDANSATVQDNLICPDTNRRVGQASSPTAEALTAQITPVKSQDDCGDDPPYSYSQSEKATGAKTAPNSDCNTVDSHSEASAQSAPDSDCDTEVHSESEASKEWQRYIAAPYTDTEVYSESEASEDELDEENVR